MNKAALITVLIGGGALLPACLGIGEVQSVEKDQSVQVQVIPGTAALATGASWTFACAVTGTADPACTWSVKEGPSGGTVTAAGVYTAPATAGTYSVVATSRADPAITASAKVTVSGSSSSSSSGSSSGSSSSGSSSSGSSSSGSSSSGSSSGSSSSGSSSSGSSSSGSSGSSSSSSSGSSSGSSSAPCDIYRADGAPCVAAHSTVRALYGAYAGNLYQVRRASDRTTRDIPVLSPGGYADAATQDAFCAGTTCTISLIYDQSPNGNHLAVSPPGGWLKNGGTEANAAAEKVTANGHPVYGVYTTGSFDEKVGGVGYRNNRTQGVPTGDRPEAMYMVASGRHYNQWCCFDYGNAETNNLNNGPGTMEAVYFGNSTQWGKGSGAGPWVMADLEEGVFAGPSFAAPASNTPLVADFVSAMLKGKPGSFALKGGDAQSGGLKTMYDGPRPAGYDPMRKEGAIILGTGGDNSHTGEGTFFEGCIVSGYPSEAADEAVQANIVAAAYRR